MTVGVPALEVLLEVTYALPALTPSALEAAIRVRSGLADDLPFACVTAGDLAVLYEPVTEALENPERLGTLAGWVSTNRGSYVDDQVMLEWLMAVTLEIRASQRAWSGVMELLSLEPARQPNRRLP